MIQRVVKVQVTSRKYKQSFVYIPKVFIEVLKWNIKDTISITLDKEETLILKREGKKDETTTSIAE